jgi:hypothetical protein
MSRGFSSRGFALPFTPPPATYTALVALFGGDKAAADAWLSGWIDYAETGAQSEALLAALGEAGGPGTVIAITLARPLAIAAQFQEPIYPDEQAIGVATTPLAGAIGVANDF